MCTCSSYCACRYVRPSSTLYARMTFRMWTRIRPVRANESVTKVSTRIRHFTCSWPKHKNGLYKLGRARCGRLYVAAHMLHGGHVRCVCSLTYSCTLKRDSSMISFFRLVSLLLGGTRVETSYREFAQGIFWADFWVCDAYRATARKATSTFRPLLADVSRKATLYSRANRSPSSRLTWRSGQSDLLPIWGRLKETELMFII